MNVFSIFIKSYAKDFKRLSLLLLSIKKFVKCSGGFNVVLVIEECDKNHKDLYIPDDLNLKLVVVPNGAYNGYIYQQEIKLRAYEWCDSKYIMFMDSDCLIGKKQDIMDFIVDGKPVLLKRKWDEGADFYCWKHPTDICLNIDSQWETMPCMPFIYEVDTLKRLGEIYNWVEYFSKGVHVFSEFNVIGNWIINNESDRYNIQDVNEQGFDNIYNGFIIQKWSHEHFLNDILGSLSILCDVHTGSCHFENQCFNSFKYGLGNGEVLDYNTINNLNPLGDIECHFDLPDNDTCVSDTIRQCGFYEKFYLNFLSLIINRNKNIIDAGANIGNHSVFLGKLIADGCKVYSFEPQPFLFEYLKRNIDHNGLAGKVICENTALGDDCGYVKMDVEYNTKINMGAFRIVENGGGNLQVPITKLDLYGFKNIGLLKIDCEFFEWNVLLGCLNTLIESKPTIMIEIHDTNPDRWRILKLLYYLGYKKVWKLSHCDYIFSF
jgi:FkbM family methyltransferase